jgi:hypothetical protein
MTRNLQALLILAALIAFPFSEGNAQSRPFGQQVCPTYSDTLPRTLPIVPQSELVGAKTSPIPGAVATKVYDRCLSRVPERFTPDAHKIYCTCTAAALQGSMTLGELIDLQDSKNRRIGHPSYEKFVTQVVKPCMVEPVEEIEYLYCMIDRAADPRIRFFPSYCQCVGKEMRKHLDKNGDIEAVMELSKKVGSRERDPTEGFLSGFERGRALQDVRNQCSWKYLDMER